MRDTLVAESGIRQLFARYADAVWRKDLVAFGACFAANGEWKIAGQHVRGRAAVAELCARLTATSERIMMLTAPSVLDWEEGGAKSRTMVTELVRLADGSGVRTLGVYYDRLVEEDGAWRFASRHWDLSYYGPPDLSGPMVPSSDYGPPPAMPDPDAPTFARGRA